MHQGFPEASGPPAVLLCSRRPTTQPQPNTPNRTLGSTSPRHASSLRGPLDVAGLSAPTITVSCSPGLSAVAVVIPVTTVPLLISPRPPSLGRWSNMRWAPIQVRTIRAARALSGQELLSDPTVAQLQLCIEPEDRSRRWEGHSQQGAGHRDDAFRSQPNAGRQGSGRKAYGV
jgi:hypothetical protein